MVKTKFKKAVSLMLAAVMSLTAFMGIGATTAFAAVGEKADVYLVDYPRSGDTNNNGEWGHGNLNYMNGWKGLSTKYPDHIALKYYRSYHSGAAKTLKSIQITLAARLEKFNLESLASLTTTDELDLPSLGEQKVALFALIPDNDSSFNFLVSILYTQLFQQLFYAADHIHGGSLPVPVHFLMDEFANETQL